MSERVRERERLQALPGFRAYDLWLMVQPVGVESIAPPLTRSAVRSLGRHLADGM